MCSGWFVDVLFDPAVVGRCLDAFRFAWWGSANLCFIRIRRIIAFVVFFAFSIVTKPCTIFAGEGDGGVVVSSFSGQATDYAGFCSCLSSCGSTGSGASTSVQVEHE